MLHHFLVAKYNKARSIVYDFGKDHHGCHVMYSNLEWAGAECVMLGADSVDTLRVTHSNWVTEESLIMVIKVVAWKSPTK